MDIIVLVLAIRLLAMFTRIVRTYFTVRSLLLLNKVRADNRFILN